MIAMTLVNVKFHSMEQVGVFVEQMTRLPYKIELTKENAKIDGKSLLGILSFGLEEPLLLSAHTEDSLTFIEKISPYL